MMDLASLQALIERGEALDREFKGERGNKPISDREIYEEVVAMANTKGGTLLVGVEDDGSVTGARPRHGQATDPVKMQSAIFSNTVPNINTRVSTVSHPQGTVLTIEVDVYPTICATSTGKALRRVIGGDGKPATVPFYPHDQHSRKMDLGLLDFTAQVIEGATADHLDPLEFERLRQTVTRSGGDKSLLGLPDKELAKALKLVESRGDRIVPNVSGLLMLGREDALARMLPTHQVMFQVLDAQGNVKANDLASSRWPVLRRLEDIESRFAARNEEREVQVGLFRVPVPDYSPVGFREAVNNAVLHRDYSKLEAVYVQWHADCLLITNPGGFPEGITPANILVHEPKPRNPRLAEVFNRIGLIEQSGRGVDRIYEGQLRYGRPAPDYSRTDAGGVRVVLRGGQPSLAFAAFVYEQDKKGTPLTLDELMVLNALFFERRVDSEAAGRLIQKGTSEGRGIMERLLERGLVEAKGEKRGRVYTMSASLYKRLGGVDGYVRSRGFTLAQQRQMVLNAVDAADGGRITREKVAELCQISGDQAYRLLRKLREDGDLDAYGKGRGAFYARKRAR